MTSAPPLLAISCTEAGCLPDGEPVARYTLRHPDGVTIELLELGATLARVVLPDREGEGADVLLGCPTWEDWLRQTAHYGATIGRWANRIAGAAFSLDGVIHAVTPNETTPHGHNHLHGGAGGFHRRRWSSCPIAEPDAVGVAFRLESPAGEAGFPGTLSVMVTYCLTADRELRIEYTATTDQPTLVNLTNHAYWNLTGDPRQSIHQHVLQMGAEAFLPTDRAQIPTGEIRSVAGTPFDFRTPKGVGRDLTLPDDQLQIGRGYDHCFVLSNSSGLRFVAWLAEPNSGRVVEVFTDQPGLQLYTGNHLPNLQTGICFEPGLFPDAPHHAHFPCGILRPGPAYRHRTVFRFPCPVS